MKLSEICSYQSERVKSNTLSVENYISTENMLPNKSGISTASKVPPEAAVHYNKGDILISNIRPYFKKIWQAQFSGGCSSDVLCIRANDRVNQDYLYYLLSQDSFFDYVMAGAKGSKMPRGDKKQIMDWEVELPDMEEQIRIATLLKAIDGKIELNNRINHNLEEQALFKVAEFLNKMSNSGAPKSLAQICDRITDGSHFSPKDCEESNIPMLSVKDMSTFGFDYHDCKHISKTDFELMRKNGCVPHAGDILIAKDGSYLKEIFMCREEIDQAILSSIAIFRANTTQVHPELLLYILKQPAILQAVKDNYVSGSALPRIVLKDFKKLTIMLPEAKEQEDIGQYLSYVSSTIFNLCKQNENLMKQRDTLLPKLISGAITC